MPYMVKLAEENKKSERLITYYYTEKKVKGMKVFVGNREKKSFPCGRQDTMRTRIVLAQVTNHKFLIHNARLPSQHHKGPTIRKVVGVGGGGR